MPAPTGNPDADHVLTLHEQIRNALFTGTHDLEAVRKALDEADKCIRDKFVKATTPAPKAAEPAKTPTPLPQNPAPASPAPHPAPNPFPTPGH